MAIGGQVPENQATLHSISHPRENQPQCSTQFRARLLALPSVAHSWVCAVSELCSLVQCSAGEQPNHTRPVALVALQV